MEFYENNCGRYFNDKREPRDEFKWAYQEGDDQDKLLISVQLTNAEEEHTGLYISELQTVESFEEWKMRTTRNSERVIEGKNYSYVHTTYYVKEE